MMKRPDSPLDAELTALHDAYTWQVNAALAQGREDLAAEVAQDFPDDALALLVQLR